MEQTTLKFLRIIVPGLAIILASFPFLFSTETIRIGLVAYQSIFLAFLLQLEILFGVFYHIIDFRSKHWKIDLAIIHEHIKQKIIEGVRKEAGFDSAKASSMESKKYLNVHYEIIDSIPSMKYKKQQVFLNGAIFTSLIDIRVISLPAALFYLVMAAIFSSEVYYITFFVLILFAIVVWPLRLMVRNRHLKLIDEQIDFYIQNSRSKVFEVLEKAYND